MELTTDKKLEMMDRLKGVLSRMGSSTPNVHRLEAMLSKIKHNREVANGPRRIEHTSGYFKYPPLDASGAAETPQTDVVKLARRMRPAFFVDSPSLTRMRNKWLAAGRVARP